MQFFLEPRGHQNGVVHRSAQLHAADDGRCDERRGSAGEVGEALIQEDRQLNGGHQHRRNGDGLERPRHDDENTGNGQVVCHHEVHGGGVNQIPVHGALAGDHGVFIVLLQDGIHLVQLGRHCVGGRRIA